jgi:hypothetical protein
MKGRMSRLLLSALAMASSASLPVFAEDGSGARSGLAVFLTWLPRLIFLAMALVFFSYFKHANARAKRWREHMDRVEQLLERIANAVDRRA